MFGVSEWDFKNAVEKHSLIYFNDNLQIDLYFKYITIAIFRWRLWCDFCTAIQYGVSSKQKNKFIILLFYVRIFWDEYYCCVWEINI